MTYNPREAAKNHKRMSLVNIESEYSQNKMSSSVSQVNLSYGESLQQRLVRAACDNARLGDTTLSQKLLERRQTTDGISPVRRTESPIRDSPLRDSPMKELFNKYQ